MKQVGPFNVMNDHRLTLALKAEEFLNTVVVAQSLSQESKVWQEMGGSMRFLLFPMSFHNVACISHPP